MKIRLTKAKEIFVNEYVKDLDAIDAYKKAFDTRDLTPKQISKRAYALLQTQCIERAVRDLRKDASKRAKIEVADILSYWKNLAMADPAELVQLRRNCCRYCYGKNHERQYTHVEYAIAKLQAKAKGKVMPEHPPGGYGYNATIDPHPRCPVCFGEGVENIFMTDTRKLSGSAKLLYAGIKKSGKNGIQILMEDRRAAWENLAKYLGMFKNKGDVIQVNVDAAEKTGKSFDYPKIRELTTDPIEATKIYKKIIAED